MQREDLSLFSCRRWLPTRKWIGLLKRLASSVMRRSLFSVRARRSALDLRKAVKRVERWNKIAVSACQQCGENYLPNIRFCSSLKMPQLTPKVEIRPEPDRKTYDSPDTPTAVTFAVGPEGGLSPKEINTLIESGFYSCKLGNRVLRTETAALAAASFAQTLWGDFR